MKKINFSTYQTGHTIKVSSADVSQEAIILLTPIIKAGGGEIPYTNCALKVAIDRGVGAAVVTFSDTKTGLPGVVCVVNWGTDYKAAWDMVESVKGGYSPNPPILAEVTFLEGQYILAYLCDTIRVMNLDDIAMLGDLEKCVGWTIIQMETNR